MISTSRFILASFYHYRRSNAATALGVIVATAVFTGAFLVGHSMRASLRELALDAIGTVDYAVLASRFTPAPDANSDAQGVILLQGTLENQTADSPHRTRAVSIYGVTPEFWGFWQQHVSGGSEPDWRACPRVFESEPILNARGQAPPLTRVSPKKKFTGSQIILNRSTAEALGAKPGDSILVRLPRSQTIPTGSLFAKKDRTESLRLTVERIISDEGPGRFALSPSQHAPMLAYVPLKTLQRQLDVLDQVNAVLAAGKPPKFQSLAQLGLHAEQPQQGEPDATFLSTDRLLFIPGSEEYLAKQVCTFVSGGSEPDWRAGPRALEVGPGSNARGQAPPLTKVQSVLTYLANSIEVGDRKIPYSTVTACDFLALADDEIALNAWAAEQLGAKLGDRVTLRYFTPGSVSADYSEATHDFRLAKILPMEGPAIDRRWAPRVPGVTDELTMANWDPPFPFDIKRIRAEDEAYWDKYRAAPKAFVSLGTGQPLWGSRFGRATSLRVTPPLDASELDSLAVELDPAKFGFSVQNVRRRALDAAVGTTSFESLFLALSFFVIAAALILVALMFRLGTDARSRQIGLLAALGFTRRRIAMLLIGEGLAISVVGSLLGVLFGVLYAQFLIFGLSTWWLGAIGSPFLSLHVDAGTLLLGFVAGTLTSSVVIVFALRRLMRIAPNRLLAGQTERTARYDRFRWRRLVAWAVTVNLWAAVVAILVAAFTVGIDARYETVTFFASGVLALAAILATIRLALVISAQRPMLTTHVGNRFRFAARGAARHPMRSMAIVGMMAATIFLVVSIGAFRIEPITNDRDVNSPTGGFQLVCQSDVPIDGPLSHGYLAHRDFGFSEEERALLRECYVITFQVYAGDNASCLNLFRPGRPQILSVPAYIRCYERRYPELGIEIKRPPKNWVEKLIRFSETNRKAKSQAIPVALEKTVANYSFQLWGRVGETFRVATDSDRPLELEVAELLGPSPFLGNLLISGYDFQHQFPEIEGYRFFLIRTPEGKEDAAREILERALTDYGFAAQRTVDRIASVSVVQNTYLATFQSLGGLGLVLGLFGLLAVEVRNVMERRGELALLLAVGFRRRTLITLLTLENSLLLLAGFLAGLFAAIVAILPHLLDTTANVPFLLLATILGVVLAISLLGLPPTASLALRRIHTRDIQKNL